MHDLVRAVAVLHAIIDDIERVMWFGVMIGPVFCAFGLMLEVVRERERTRGP